ncbi:hypothetical protein M413DRAFT_34847, partial [Hebeloma cylindrosporum]
EKENTSFQSNATNVSEILTELDTHNEQNSDKQIAKNMYAFLKDHPLYDTHALRLIPENDKIIPNFLPNILPRRDQGDREYYCATMLALFQPWRTGEDLKQESESWDDAFTNYPFTDFQKKLMNQFNIRYECHDARDDYRAQLKKGTASYFTSSWDDPENSTDSQDFIDNNPKNDDLDDIPLNFLNIGKSQYNRLKEMEMMNNILRNVGW